MTKFNVSFHFILFLGLLIFACNKNADGQAEYRTQVTGNLTADEDHDLAGDLSGINLFIVDRAVDPADTLFRAETDASGNFSGDAVFGRTGEYPALIRKDNRTLDEFTLVLAQDDTVRIESDISDPAGTRQVNSVENEALRIYRRLDSQFYRVANLINAGAVDDEEIPGLINTWADLFWSVREDFPNTVAAGRATQRSLETLEGWDDKKTLERINSDLSDENLQEAAIYFGTVAKLRLEGLDASIAFLEELDERLENEASKRLIVMNQVELLFDSLRVDQARETLNKYELRFRDNPDSVWSSSMSYEINNLAPGMPMPDFELQTVERGAITNRSLLGEPYLLEIVELSSRRYQSFHPSINELVESYSEAGLKLITVPLEHSAITINAFYGERPKPWAVAASRAYEEANLIEILNINQLPLRVLVDGEGNIVKKYIGNSLQQLEQDIETLIN